MDAKAMWGSGNLAAVAERVLEVGELILERVGADPGMDVLDVACGTGNATIPAARLGARVTGLDFSPELLAVARERAADAMVEIEWVEGDAGDLPFADGSFDRVISTFGHMFAPDHARSGSEMRRVCRPGGKIGVCCWTPEGTIGEMFRALGALSPPPDGTQPPVLWGTEDHVRRHLGEAEFERAEVEWRDESVESYAQFMEESFGPLIAAREQLGDIVHETYLDYLNRVNAADDGTLRFRGEYLVAVVSV
jgi:ubiquinone/menaquinone biosynthesis C-methylase UbiE